MTPWATMQETKAEDNSAQGRYCHDKAKEKEKNTCVMVMRQTATAELMPR